MNSTHLKSRIASAEDYLRQLGEDLAVFHRVHDARAKKPNYRGDRTLTKDEIADKNDIIAEFNKQQRLVDALKDQLKALESR